MDRIHLFRPSKDKDPHWEKRQEIKRANRKNIRTGTIFSKDMFRILDHRLGISGDDARILYMMCAQRVLYNLADSSAHAYSRNHGADTFYVLDSKMGVDLKGEAADLGRSTDEFIKAYPPDKINRASVIRRAAADFLANTNFFDSRTGFNPRIADFTYPKKWGDHWRPIIEQAS